MSELKIPPGSFEPIMQREEDGKWSIGWHDDAPGPFESRRHAEAVATRSTGDPPKRRRPRRANPRPLHNRLDRAAASTSYATSESFSTGRYRAIAPNGLLVGVYASRLEAAQAFSGACP